MKSPTHLWLWCFVWCCGLMACASPHALNVSGETPAVSASPEPTKLQTTTATTTHVSTSVQEKPIITPTSLHTATATLVPTPTPLAVGRLTEGSFTLVSASSQGDVAAFDSYDPAVSADGRFVVFASDANNLVAGDTNLRTDIFLYDLHTGMLERVSVSSTGREGAGHSYTPDISGNGRFIVFSSQSLNLVEMEHKNSGANVYLVDRETNITTLISAPVADAPLGRWDALCPAISDDGRFIAFLSGARNISLLPNGELTQFATTKKQIFVHDRQEDVTMRVGLADPNMPLNYEAHCPQITAEGNRVVFYAEERSITSTGGAYFVYDVASQRTEVTFFPGTLLNTEFSLGGNQIINSNRTIPPVETKRWDLAGKEIPLTGTLQQIHDQIGIFQPTFSDDGTVLVFWGSERLAEGIGAPAAWILYRYRFDTDQLDTIFSALTMERQNPSARPNRQISSLLMTGVGFDVLPMPAVSYDGSVIAFLSIRTDIVPFEPNGTHTAHVFVYRDTPID